MIHLVFVTQDRKHDFTLSPIFRIFGDIKTKKNMKEFIIEMAVTILAKAIKAKPNSKLARILLDEKVKNTVKDVNKYYLMLELQADEEEDNEDDNEE